MKSLRSLQGRVRTLFKRTEHSGGYGDSGLAGGASTSGRGLESKAVQSTPVFQHFNGRSAHYGPQKNYGIPWKEGVLLLSGGALGWVASRNLSVTDIPRLEWEAIASYFRGTGSLPFAIGHAAAAAGPNFLADAAAKAAPAVVNINVNLPPGSMASLAERTCGSGFITDPSGIIMTNAHVVADALQKQQAAGSKPGAAPLKVALQDGRVLEGRVLSMDNVSDLALVKVEAKGPLPSVKMGSSEGMRVGEWVLALGSPLTLQNSVTAGIVSCVGRKAKELGLAGTTANYIQTDAAINTGNSGGPLVNLAGEVVGVSCMKALHSTGVSFAIPIDSARKIMDQLQGQGRVVRPYIGIKMLQLNAQNAAQMQQRDSKFPAITHGILVPSVTTGSPAAKAGLQQGDIITGYGEDGDTGVELSTEALIQALTRNIRHPLRLKVRRNAEDLVLTITACEAHPDC